MTSLRAITIIAFFIVMEAAVAIETYATGSSVIVPRLSEFLAVVGTGLVAFTLQRDDPPRRPWMVFFIAMITVPIARLVGMLGLSIAGFPVKVLILIVSNVAIVAALFLFTTVLRDSGFAPDWDDPEHRGTRNGLIGIISVLVLAAFANEYLVITRATSTSNLVIQTISMFADTAICAAGLYMMWLVRPLMGGSVAQPFLLIAIGGGVFIVMDFIQTIQQVATQDELASPILTGMALLGWSCFALAGFAQRRLLKTAEG